MRHAKSKFCQDKITDCPRSNNPKKAWTLVNSLLGKQRKMSSCSELSVNDNIMSDRKAMAEALNEYFVSIGPILAAWYDKELSNNSDQSLKKNCDTFSPEECKFSNIPVHNVVSTLQGLKSCKSTGLDKILKLSASIIAPSWTHIFNLFVMTSIYAEDWKRARVTPYRPISI